MELNYKGKLQCNLSGAVVIWTDVEYLKAIGSLVYLMAYLSLALGDTN